MGVKDELREHLNVFNAHNYATVAGVNVWIDYRPQVTGRGYQSAAWQVFGNGFQTEDSPERAHWRNYGLKTFNVFRREYKQSQLEAALAWASERYGIPEWERTPFGSYVPKGTVAIMRAKLADAKRAAVVAP